jgi:drug/metabolite transporter (DMT)-like permease
VKLCGTIIMSTFILLGFNAKDFAVVSLFSLCGVCMLLANKGAVKVCGGFIWTLLTLQTTVTLVLLAVWAAVTKQDFQLNMNEAKAWLPCALLFVGCLFTGLEVFKHISVSTFTVFRNLQNLLVAYLEWQLLGTVIPWTAVAALVGIVFGVVLYAMNDLSFSMPGYLLALAGILLHAAYNLMVRNVNNKIKLNKFSMSVY